MCAAALLCFAPSLLRAAEDQAVTPIPASDFPIASDARLAGDAKQTRFVLDLDKAESLPQLDVDAKNGRLEVALSKAVVKKVETAIASGDKSLAAVALTAAQPEMQRASGKGVIHSNTVARKLSRLSARIKALPAT